MRRALLSGLFVLSCAAVGCGVQPEIEGAPVAAPVAVAPAAPAAVAAPAAINGDTPKDGNMTEDELAARNAARAHAMLTGGCLPPGPDDPCPLPGNGPGGFPMPKGPVETVD